MIKNQLLDALREKMKNRFFIYGILMVAMFPLLFINLQNTHDWGGDFAQYIQQASNIVEGRKQSESYYIFNPDNPYLAPPSYSVGFPILLAPVYAVFGNSILAFNIYLSFLLMLCGVFTFIFLKKYVGHAVALLSTLLFVYNPWILTFKASILSDIPFLLFFISSLVLFKDYRNSKLKSIVLGLLIGFSIMIRSLGIVLVVALLIVLFIDLIHARRKNEINTIRWQLYLFPVGVSVLFYITVTEFFLPTGNESFSFFSSLFDFGKLGETILKTSDYYIYNFQELFQNDNGMWSFAPSLTKAMMISLLIIGLFLSAVDKVDYKLIVFVLYLGIVLSFPNMTQGIRYMLPLFPLCIYFIVKAFSSMRIESTINMRYLPVVIFLLIGLQYKKEIKSMLDRGRIVMDGPQHTESKEVFSFIESHTNKDSKIIFTKPRVLGLYAQRYSYTNDLGEEIQPAEKQFNKIGFDYILTCNDLPNAPLDSFIVHHSYDLEVIFENQKFKLHQRK